MTFKLETGAGTPGANSYVTAAFVTAYLTDRNRETENNWSTAGALQELAAIAATDYIEKRYRARFKGTPFRIEITGRNAYGTVTLTAVPLEGELVTVAGQAFKFTATLAAENDVLIGATAEASIDNLVDAALGNSSNAGTTYHENTRQSFEATLSKSLVSSDVLDVVAVMTGENGNSIDLSTTVTGATASGATLSGGIDQSAQPLSFPRSGLTTSKGEKVIGIPLRLKQATAEYAVRSLAAALAPDPSVDDSLVAVQAKTDKVGPIEESRTFAEGAVPQLFKSYPAADQLLAEYVTATGGTLR